MAEKLVPYCYLKDKSKVECPDKFPNKVGNKCYKQCENKFLKISIEKDGKISEENRYLLFKRTSDGKCEETCINPDSETEYEDCHEYREKIFYGTSYSTFSSNKNIPWHFK